MLRDKVLQSLSNAEDNGYELRDLSAKEIAEDLHEYDADIENVPVSELEPLVMEWLSNPRPLR